MAVACAVLVHLSPVRVAYAVYSQCVLCECCCRVMLLFVAVCGVWWYVCLCTLLCGGVSSDDSPPFVVVGVAIVEGRAALQDGVAW